MIESLHRRGERYLRLKLEMPLHKGRSDEEHEQLYDACRNNDIQRATAILEAHLLQTGEMLANLLRGGKS
jgi:DNA-binding GntR family transcriptional regulator